MKTGDLVGLWSISIGGIRRGGKSVGSGRTGFTGIGGSIGLKMGGGFSSTGSSCIGVGLYSDPPPNMEAVTLCAPKAISV
jgi:hypothetical protein